MIERNITSKIVIPKEKSMETYHKFLEINNVFSNKDFIKKEEFISLSFIPCTMDQEDIEEVCLIIQDVFDSPRLFDEVYEMWRDLESYEELEIVIYL